VLAVGVVVFSPGPASASLDHGPPFDDECESEEEYGEDSVGASLFPFGDGCGTIEVHKVDDTEAPLAGVTFVLLADEEDTEDYEAAGEPGDPVEPAKTCTTDDEGFCAITDVPPGTYWVAEEEPPAGHDGAAPQQVEIEEPDCFPFLNSLAEGADGAAAAELEASELPFCFPECFPLCFIFDGATAEEQAAAEAAFTAATVAAAGAELGASDSPFPPCFPFCPPEPEVVSLTFVNARKAAGLTVTKTVNGSSTTAAAPLVIESGNGLDYAVTVANTGELPLTVTELTDTRQSDLPSSCPQGIGSTLAAGASFTCNYSATAADDANATATAGATDQFGRAISASAGSSVDVIHPGVALSLGANPSTVGAGGGQVTLDFVVTNTGDTPLTNIVVTDEQSGATGITDVLPASDVGMVAAASFTGGPASVPSLPGELAPGASRTYTKTVLVAGDAPTTHIGRVTATHPLGTIVGATASATVTPEQAAAAGGGGGASVLGVSLSRPATPGTALAATGASSIGRLVRLGLLLVLLGVAFTIAANRRRTPAAR